MLWIICASVAGGALSLLAAALVSFTVLSAWVPRMVSFAVGAMLAAAFLHLLPEAVLQANSVEALFATTLTAILAFFLREKAALCTCSRRRGLHLRCGRGPYPRLTTRREYPRYTVASGADRGGNRNDCRAARAAASTLKTRGLNVRGLRQLYGDEHWAVRPLGR